MTDSALSGNANMTLVWAAKLTLPDAATVTLAGHRWRETRRTLPAWIA